MVTEDYVSFETAKLLKEKGFEGDVNAYYHIWDNGHRVCPVQEFTHSEAPHLYIPAPTQSMAMKWLREEYNLFIWVSAETRRSLPYYYQIFDLSKKEDWVICIGDSIYGSYEQAVEAAIKYCLDNFVR